jgi:NhaP-type Na+/H+ or K+/H+ antiporter
MKLDILAGIGLIVILGVGLQLLGHLLRFPSIVLLLAGGLVVGPGLGLVNPDEILGPALFPVVSLSVGVLLFVGGLELHFADLGASIRRPVGRLVSFGVVITWLLTAVAAHLLFHQPVEVSVLLGAILVVSGPTVVEPLLRLSRPRRPVDTILRWEGIIIDPVGATLSLFCFSAFFVDGIGLRDVWSEFVVVALAGVMTGIVIASLLVLALHRLLIPEELEVAVTFTLVVAAFVLAESVRAEAGLFATASMGVLLANQKVVETRRLKGFGQPVVSLLIGTLFMVLASRLHPGAIERRLSGSLALIAFLVLVVRPLVVGVCTRGVPALTWRHRVFLACMAPRGIVAASTAAFYSLRLQQLQQPSEALVPVTFAVIIGLSIIYGLAAIPVSRALGVNRPPPQGLLLVSPRAWAVGLARELARAGVPTLLVARGRWSLVERSDLPFPVYADLLRDLPEGDRLIDMRDAIIASPDDETNLVAVDVLGEALGREHIYLLSSSEALRHDRQDRDIEAWTRPPFAGAVTLEQLHQLGDDEAAIRTIDASRATSGLLVLAAVAPNGQWTSSPRSPFAAGTRLVVADAPSALQARAEQPASVEDLAPP